MIKPSSLAWQYLKDYQKKSQPYLAKYFGQEIKKASAIGRLPKESLDYFFQLCQKGKKIRGSLVELGYQISGGQEMEKIIDTSLFIELFHSAILIHDDIMDQDATRRGMASGHFYFADYGRKNNYPRPKHFGLANAITLADTGFYLSWQKLLNSGFQPELKLRAGRVLADFIIRLTYGQMLDIANNFSFHHPAEEILKIFNYKTAEYTGSLPLLIGSILAGRNKPKLEKKLVKYGLAFGWIFQIQDDILGIFGQAEKIGKPLGSDLIQAKNTILVWYVGQQEEKKYRLELEKLMAKKKTTSAEVAKAKQIFSQSGAYDYSRKLAKKYLDQGLKIIPAITSETKYQNLLKSFLYLAYNRQK